MFTPTYDKYIILTIISHMEKPRLPESKVTCFTQLVDLGFELWFNSRSSAVKWKSIYFQHFKIQNI